MRDLDRFRALTFDCYGTLVDWESGILAGLRPVLEAHGVSAPDDAVLERYAALESAAESGEFRPYREVLAEVVEGFGRDHGFEPSHRERTALVESFGRWVPFPDTVGALRKLATRFRLAIVSNVDDDLFAITAGHLPVSFDAVVTAGQVGAYKPSSAIFTAAIERLRLPPEQVLHVAQSLHHDVAPARELGLTTVWVNRRADRPGFGATPASAARPDVEVPDLAALVDLVGIE